MTLEEFVAKGWNDHGDDAAGVFARFPEGVLLVKDPAHLPALAGLIVHVGGEHLGRWRESIALLERLEKSPVFDRATVPSKAVLRSMSVLHRCAGHREEEERCARASRTGGDVPAASDRIRVLAAAAAVLLGQGRLAEAKADFLGAVSLILSLVILGLT